MEENSISVDSILYPIENTLVEGNSIIQKDISHAVIEILDPKKISDSKIEQVSNTFREMWSSENGLQELVQCLSCNSISSKKDIFGHLESFIYEIDVSDIMKIHGMKYIPCPCCRHETRFIYGNEYTDDIRKRLLDSIDSFLVVAENYGNPVGGLLWYIPNSFEEMYQLEFKDHYANIGVEKIKNTVNIKLNGEQNNMLMFAAVGFLDKYRNPFHLIEFLRLAYVNLPKKHYGLPGIMELDKNNLMHKLFTSIGGISLGLGEENNISNTGKFYKSDIVILPNAAEVFGEYFGPNVSKRKIFKLLQQIK